MKPDKMDLSRDLTNPAAAKGELASWIIACSPARRWINDDSYLCKWLKSQFPVNQDIKRIVLSEGSYSSKVTAFNFDLAALFYMLSFCLLNLFL